MKLYDKRQTPISRHISSCDSITQIEIYKIIKRKKWKFVYYFRILLSIFLIEIKEKPQGANTRLV